MNCNDKFRNMVANIVCRKPLETLPEVCFSRNSFTGYPCNKYGKCRVFEKTDQQLEYITHDYHIDSFLEACPGSGKTEVVALKAAYNIVLWDVSVGGIATLSFTRNAVNVIKERVSQYTKTARTSFPHFIGTFDSWLHQYIAQPFGWLITKKDGDDKSIKIIEASNSAGFLNNFQTNFPLEIGKIKAKIKANEFFRDYGTNKYLNILNGYSKIGKNWGELKELEATKHRFFKSGFANYEDMEFIALTLLANNKAYQEVLARRFPCIIIDECQDLSWAQLTILEKLMEAGSNVHLIGDLNQAIYGFKRVDPQDVRTFIHNHSLHQFSLTRNFRSVQPIVDICNKIIPSEKRIIGNKYDEQIPTCLYIGYNYDKLKSLVADFEAFLLGKGFSLADCAVVTRAKSIISRISPYRQEKGNHRICFASSIYMWEHGNLQAKEQALSYFGFFLAKGWLKEVVGNESNYYCPKNLESNLSWRLFLAEFLTELCKDDEISNLEQPWHKWAQVIRSKFDNVVSRCSQGIMSFDVKLNFRAPRNMGEKIVLDTLDIADQVTSSCLRITTIHAIKGDTLDAILVVSSKKGKSKGGYWKQWVCPAEEDDEEYKRIGYVASSRPRKLLVWAVPSPSDDDIEMLENLGFSKVVF